MNNQFATIQNASNYRYFTLPIEQIPGWDPDSEQMLVHLANQGLWWQNIPSGIALDVVTCVRLTPSGLVADRVTINALVIGNSVPCETIAITDCPQSN